MTRLFAFFTPLALAAQPFVAGVSAGVSAGVPEQARESEAVQGLRALQLLDQRMHATGYRLVSANMEFCPEQIPHTGLLLHDINQYGDKNAARLAHGFSGPIAISAVAPDSPAAAVALQVGDSLTAIDGIPVDQIVIDAEKLADEKPDYRRIAAVKERLIEAGDDGKVVLKVRRGGTDQLVSLIPAQACRSQFQIRVSRDREASADGKMVSISSTLAEYVQNDDELAAIAAHELAHNLLKHRERLNAQKVNRGFFGQFGKSAGRIKAAEIEADRLSIWLMANAGYDPQAAIRFWTRYGKRYGKGIFSAATHYRWKKRVKLFEEEIAKMAQRDAAGGKYAPPLLMAQQSQ